MTAAMQPELEALSGQNERSMLQVGDFDMSNMREDAVSATANAASLTPLRIGQVELIVHDLEAMAGFYQDAIGLQRLHSTTDSVTLGTATTALLVLRRDVAARPRLASEAGLFHTAFLLPDRADLGRWLVHAANTGVRLTGAADHRVSEAIYLDDPEANGIEIYVDRPPQQWVWRDGEVVMGNERLDLAELARADGAWSGAPEDAMIGHVHLQVSDLAIAQGFYSAITGFDVTCHYPGALFMGSGGYHHHLAANIWNSRGAPAPDRPVAGLSQVEILVNETAQLDAIAARADAAGAAVVREPGAIRLTDPWGIQALMRYAPASTP